MFLSRKSLLHEIKATKDVLMSSLKNVQDLEVESRRVPQLEARIDDLEKLLPIERFTYFNQKIFTASKNIFPGPRARSRSGRPLVCWTRASCCTRALRLARTRTRSRATPPTSGCSSASRRGRPAPGPRTRASCRPPPRPRSSPPPPPADTSAGAPPSPSHRRRRWENIR